MLKKIMQTTLILLTSLFVSCGSFESSSVIDNSTSLIETKRGGGTMKEKVYSFDELAKDVSNGLKTKSITCITADLFNINCILNKIYNLKINESDLSSKFKLTEDPNMITPCGYNLSHYTIIPMHNIIADNSKFVMCISFSDEDYAKLSSNVNVKFEEHYLTEDMSILWKWDPTYLVAKIV